ncbi:MAG: hypothetical protein KAU01_07490 [Candidatus Cloacimonetes bacterium]|nr:hypothetical protein [Candidatus Cloacimonadota bacterium]
MKCKVMSIALIVGFLFIMVCCEDDKCPTCPTNPGDQPYNITIDPADFEDTITGNTFMPLVSGTTFFYEGEDEEGEIVTVEEHVTDSTITIIGVTCFVVEVQEYEDGELVEDTDDWYAQDLDGNIWYFGEYSEEIEDGQVVSTAGSWEAGVDGALPGIIMLADPIEGLWYRQEYYEGEAEDCAQILSLDASVTVTYGTFDNCLQTAEWNLLEPGIVEHKFYAADVGLLRAVAVEGESGFEDLVNITP